MSSNTATQESVVTDSYTQRPFPASREEAYLDACTRYPLRPSSPLYLGPNGVDDDHPLQWKGVNSRGNEVYFAPTETYRLLPLELSRIATSDWLFQFTNLNNRVATLPVIPLNKFYASNFESPISPEPYHAVVGYYADHEEEATILKFRSGQANGRDGVENHDTTATHTFIFTGILSQEQISEEMCATFPDLMYWLTNAYQNKIKITGIVKTGDISQFAPAERSNVPAKVPVDSKVSAQPAAAEYLPRQQRERLPGIRRALGRVATGMGRFRRPQMPEKLRGGRAIGALATLAVACTAAYAGYFDHRYATDLSTNIYTHLHALTNLIDTPPTSRGAAEAVNNTSGANVAAHGSIPHSLHLHHRPRQNFYLIKVGNYNAATGRGTVYGDTAIELHKQGIAHPSPNKINEAFHKILAWNRHKLAGQDPNKISAIQTLRIPLNLAR